VLSSFKRFALHLLYLTMCSVALTFFPQRVNNAGSAACTNCPVNTNTWILTQDIDWYWSGYNGNSALTACTCNPGYTGPDGEACQSCPVGTYKIGAGKCKSMVICNLPQPCVRCTEHCTDKFDATPEYECILQAIKRVPPVPKILHQPRKRCLGLHASATPVTWTFHSSAPYAPRQNPVHQDCFALLSTEEGRECACRVSLFLEAVRISRLHVVHLGSCRDSEMA
jgi:hypothetical protein